MKRKLIFPIAFSLLLTSFTAYSVLDTLVLEGGDVIEVIDDDTSFSNVPNNNNNNTDNNDDKDKPDDNKPAEEKENNAKIDADKNYLHSYEDDDLNIKIFKETVKTKHMKEDKMMDTIVFCADVRISNVEHLRTRFAKAAGAEHPTFGRNITNYTSRIAVDGGAIFAINGDYYGAREKGYVLRNGKVYREKGYSEFREDLVIYRDGSFGIFDESKVKLSEITENPLQAWQVFSFGPALVKDKKISVNEDDEVAKFSELGNQRCSIGIYEPFHYFIAICEGRLSDSYGMTLYEMGDFMQKKGVDIAYNLDGGGSATMWFNGKVLNRPNTNGDKDIGERKISDIIFFK